MTNFQNSKYMLNKIKKIRQKYILLQQLQLTRVKKIHNLQTAKRIAVIFDIDEEINWKIIEKFATELGKRDKEMMLLGRKRKKDIDFIINNTSVTVCDEGDTNFWGVPKNYPVGKFLNQHFDVMIDTIAEPDFFSKYVSLKAIADFKISRDKDDNEKYFDLLIRIDDGNDGLIYFLKQVLHYMNLITLEKI